MTLEKENNENFEYKEKIEIEVDEELNDLLSEMDKLKDSFNEKKMDSLIDGCMTVVVDSIIGPFGLSRSLFQDKDGGNVDTVHNVRNNIYATEAEKEKYRNNPEYDSIPYHQHESYIKNNKLGKEKIDRGELQDEYTGIFFKQKEKYDQDHNISANEIHWDQGRILADLNGPDLANKKSNLYHTHKSINRSKKQRTSSEFIEYLNNKNDEHNKAIEELSTKENLSKEEQAKLDKTQQLTAVDTERLLERDKIARKEYNWEINKTYYTSKKFILNSVKTSAVDGVKLGFRQAIGFILKELAEATFHEIRDCIKNRKQNSTLINEIKIRFSRIIERLQAKWKYFLAETKRGLLSGLLTNLITILTNSVAKTIKNIVKIIREVVTSVVRAINIIRSANQGSLTEAFYEAIKVLSAAFVTIFGIAMEESIKNILISFSIPFADTIAPVITGILTGIFSILVLYLFDSLKARFELNHKKVLLSSMGSVANQYKTLQTLILLEKSVAFTREMNLAIEASTQEFKKQLAINTQDEKDDIDDFNNLLDKFNNIIK